MVGDRVAAVVDYSEIDSVICADQKMKERYFPGDRWELVKTGCAPKDICLQLEKADRMIIRDEQQKVIHTVEKEKLVARLANETFLYLYDVELGVWVAKKIYLHKVLYAKCGYIWLLCDLTGWWIICYAVIAGAFANGVAPR
jgi:hypothetical protein